MKFKYLPIVFLLVAGNGYSQESFVVTPQTEIYAETTVPALSSFTANTTPPEAYVAPRLPFSNDGIGVSRVSLYFNFAGGYNMSSASYSGIKASGGGLRLQGDIGAKIPVMGNNTVCDNFLSIGLGIASIRIKDKYSGTGPSKEVKNDYVYGGIWFPISFTSVNYRFDDDKGLYWTAGANIGYASADANGKDITATCNKVAFEPFVSFGYSLIAEPKRGKIAMENLLIGPIVSYNAVNVFKTSGQSLHYFSFGVQLTAIAMEWNL